MIIRMLLCRRVVAADHTRTSTFLRILPSRIEMSSAIVQHSLFEISAQFTMLFDNPHHDLLLNFNAFSLFFYIPGQDYLIIKPLYIDFHSNSTSMEVYGDQSSHISGYVFSESS